ncbi:MAG: type II toxin-antitoxin system RelE/ParE family toxin [Gammaproteobacteria bacterium]
MKIKWLRKALENLEQEAAYISRENSAAAKTVVRRIFKSVAMLADSPALGHPGRIPGTRELIVANTRYIIPYRVRPRLKQIEILRVFHVARKPPESWK